MASIYELLYLSAMASGLSPDTLVIVTVQWRVGLDMFDPAYQPPQEYLITVADLQNKFVPPDSGVREMIVVNTDVLNIRPEPNTSKPRIGYLKRGDMVKVRGSGDWLQLVEANGKPRTGYVAAQYLRTVP